MKGVEIGLFSPANIYHESGTVSENRRKLGKSVCWKLQGLIDES